MNSNLVESESEAVQSSESILFIGFNQDFECFMCGLESGYRIYNTEPKSKTKTLIEIARGEGGGLKQIEMLYRCNYVGIIGGGKMPKYSKNKAVVWDDYQKKVAIPLEFQDEVLAIKLRRDKITIVFEKLIKVYTFSLTPQLLHVFETFPNPSGICCLCSHSSNSNMAYLHIKTGHVSIIDLANTPKPPITFQAHDTAISCMAMSTEGEKIATSSIKGTLIRVFNSENGVLLHELRRGANNANIFCINFNKGATRLCVSSDHGTIHIFSLDSSEKKAKSSLANATFLPKYFHSKWSSFKFDINNNSKCICAFSQNTDSIIAICFDGTYYKYSLNNLNNTKMFQLDLCIRFLEIDNDKLNSS